MLKIDKIKDFGTNYELLESIMLFQSPTNDKVLNEAKANFLLDLIKDYAGVQGIKVKDNLYFTKGEAEFYPTVVAHYDTAQKYHQDMQIIKTKDWIFGFDNHTAGQCGIGADDSVGLYFGIEMLKRLDHCKMVLFHSEEQGCVGSHACDMSFFDDSIIVTQLDRRSYTTDFITHTNGVQVFSSEHEELVKPILDVYGYSFARGICTDVGALRQEGLAVSSLNLSCGYLNEHTDTEVIHINSMENAFCFAEDMLVMLMERNEQLIFPAIVKFTPQYVDELDFSSLNYATFKDREKFTYNEKEIVLQNMYVDYNLFEVDTDYLCTYEPYYGTPDTYEQDLWDGILSPELYVALTGNGVNMCLKEVWDGGVTDARERLLDGKCPTSHRLVENAQLYYHVEHGVIHCEAQQTYIPYKFSPDDCFELPDDTRETLTGLCNDYNF